MVHVRTNIETVADAHNGTNRENTIKFCQFLFIFMDLLEKNLDKGRCMIMVRQCPAL